MLKRISSFFTSEKHHTKPLFVIYFAGVFAFALLILLVMRRTGSDDTIFQTQIQPYHTAFDWLGYRYMHWSGRIFSELFVYIFSQISVHIWRIVTILLFAAFSGAMFAYYKLFTKERSPKKDISMLILAIIAPFLMDTGVLFDGVFWVTGAINYFWMTTLALVAFYPIAYYTIRRSQPHWYVTILSLTSGIVAGSSQEQAGLVLVGMVFIFITYLFTTRSQHAFKKLPLYPLIFFVIFAISLFISIWAPGNKIRLQEETLVWLPDFYTTPLPQHVGSAYRWLLDATINHTGFLLVGSWLLLLLLFIKKRSKDLLDRAYIVGLSIISAFTLAKGFDSVTYWFTFYATWHPQIPHKFSFLVLSLWGVVLLATIVAPIILYRKNIHGYLVAILYIATFLSTALITLSPTMYASGARTLLTPSIILIVIIYFLSTAVYDAYKLQQTTATLMLVSSLAASQYILLASKIAAAQ